MKKAMLITIALLLCLTAVPCSTKAVSYETDLGCAYTRLLDMRNEIYKGIGIPNPGFTDKFGGLSERTLIMGNLQIIPQLVNDNAGLKKLAKAQDVRIKKLEAQVAALVKPVEVKDPNRVE